MPPSPPPPPEKSAIDEFADMVWMGCGKFSTAFLTAAGALLGIYAIWRLIPYIEDTIGRLSDHDVI